MALLPIVLATFFKVLTSLLSLALALVILLKNFLNLKTLLAWFKTFLNCLKVFNKRLFFLEIFFGDFLAVFFWVFLAFFFGEVFLGRIDRGSRRRGVVPLTGVRAQRPPPATVAWTRSGQFWKLLRIRPTARPSISKGSPGSTTMVG